MEIYLEVYKLHRLPGSPPSEPAIWEEIMAKVPDHPHREEDQMHEAALQSCPRGSHSSRSRTPCRRNDNSVGQTLATVQEAHQKVLAAISTLEREIERLHCTRAQSQLRARSKSRDHHRLSGEGWKRRCCQVRFVDEPAPSQSTNPKMPPGEEGSQGRGSDLEELPELKPTVASFLQGSPETLDEEGEKMPPEPDITDFGWWVSWKSERCETPDWWEELLAVLGKEDARRLAREVRASFTLPQQMWELDSREATLQAPPALPCLCRKKFMPPANSIFACRDIQEIPREKVVAYARALQYWAEQNNLPARGEPCLLARSVLELREEVRWYLSFTMRRSLRGWLSLRKKRKKVHRPLALLTYPRPLACQSQCWKEEPQSLWDGRRCCTHPNQWWLLEIYLDQPGPQGQRWKQDRPLR